VRWAAGLLVLVAAAGWWLWPRAPEIASPRRAPDAASSPPASPSGPVAKPPAVTDASPPTTVVVGPGDRRPGSRRGLRAAHERARATLSGVAARYRAGLPEGTQLLVKHGFPTPGGAREFMWVTVTAWPAGAPVQGTLSNKPEDAELELGQALRVAEAGIFDWMLVHPDGRREGAFTTQALSGPGR
jgi:hypothetical protein